MTYYGTPSKGCERCRRRKVKCDQRVPGCFKCSKSGFRCPGYRNLSDVVFRDESMRIIRRVEKQKSVVPKSSSEEFEENLELSVNDTPSYPLGPFWFPLAIPQKLHSPRDDLAANFFFANFTHNEPPFADEYNNWLMKSLLDKSNILRKAIEAVGLAGISNVSYIPEFASRSRQLYGEVVVAVKQDLKCLKGATADTTLMAIILLGFYEELNLESSDQKGYEYWAAHVKGATALLELRGQDQFIGQRGGLLYLLLRSQILTCCLQQQMSVPHCLVKASSAFQSSNIRENWKTRSVASAGSLCVVSFRVVNLRAAFKKGDIDYLTVRNEALDINSDLQIWQEGMPSSWMFSSEPALDSELDAIYGGVIHKYSSMWVAEAWNNWRLLRLLVSQIIQQNEKRAPVPDVVRQLLAEAMIRHTSYDLCVSASTFARSPRIISLIRPLSIISRELVNDTALRTFAMKQVRRIGKTVGSRQACLLADIAAELLASNSDSGWQCGVAAKSEGLGANVSWAVLIN
ncbi:hypothetical protein B0J11DRAFT_529503 [Dendryphion nanum]|uniref:Zn(2)-C6 fungal-type domain-containing protein n=1 Tax=Dendryphion nanum TaxID=256645 RepID=A0A9P9IKA7_9PLEO|nr:hypothetical protein B0J11DRAFT_529503 [Dendryphion nanum]